MSPDALALLGVALGALVLLGTVLARRTAVPEPVVLVVVGVAASLLPVASDVQVPPDLVLLGFLPLLLFRAASQTSPRTLRENITPLALLSVGLVLATAFAVAAISSLLVPGLGFAEGLVLGAVVGPTDPVAAAAVFRRLGAPQRVTDLVEGESLLNDATALVLLAVAIQSVEDGPPTVLSAAGALALAVLGGVAFGYVVARVVVPLRRRLGEDVGLQLLLSLLVPFVAYVPADHVGASGVLAVVTTGVVLGAGRDGVFTPGTRLPASAFWALLELLLNAVLFVLLGLEIRTVVEDLPDLGSGDLVLSAAAVVLTVLVVRMLWQFVVPPPVYALRERFGAEVERSTPGERFAIGWTGMRGAVSLAAALSVPLMAGSEPFPGRPQVLFLTVCVLLATLVVQGTTLGLVLRATGLESDDLSEVERATRLALYDAALTRLDELEQTSEVEDGSLEPLRRLWDHRRAEVQPDAEPDTDLTGARRAVTEAQRDELDARRQDGRVPPAMARQLRAELDLQDARTRH